MSQPVEKCFFFKERNYDKASNNHISITFGSLDSVLIYIIEKNEEESLDNEVDIDRNEGWILLTWRRRNKSSFQKIHLRNRLEGKF